MKIPVDSWSPFLKAVEDNVTSGSALGFADAVRLTGLPERKTSELTSVADRVRRRFARDKADLCSIVNARSGHCAEDCGFCAQSRHYQTDVEMYPMRPAAEILKSAQTAEAAGAHRFCIVTSGGALRDADFDTVLRALELIGKETGLKRCASIGRLDPKRALELRQVGLDRYHHNIETALSFFPSVCTTHTYEDKCQTISHLKSAGIETCVGGILNMGETPRQRIEFAFEIKELDPESVPINFLIPRPGTPLGGMMPMPALEAAKYLAIFRLIMPHTSIRIAGGRLETFSSNAALPFNAGANALLIGNLLTTAGPDTRSDIALLTCLGFDVNGSD